MKISNENSGFKLSRNSIRNAILLVMNNKIALSIVALTCCIFSVPAVSNDSHDRAFKIFQFPRDQIPRIDGEVFGDGETSTEQNPIHHFEEARGYVTILEVTGPDGTSKRSKVWDVQLR